MAYGYCGAFESMEETAEMMKSLWQAATKGDKGTEKIEEFMKRNFDFNKTPIKSGELITFEN